MTDYSVKTTEELKKVVEDCPAEMPVELGPGVDLTSSVRTVGDLRKLASLPANIRVVTPRDKNLPEAYVRLELIGG